MTILLTLWDNFAYPRLQEIQSSFIEILSDWQLVKLCFILLRKATSPLLWSERVKPEEKKIFVRY